MSEVIPQAVLSEAFQARMKGRRLVSAVFTTFRFEPSFFETEVLPVFLDIPLSHAAAIKLVQLEDAIRTVPGSIAVYYDSHGLVADGGPAKLDARRFAIRHRTGIFHPKNVLVLVEANEADADGRRPRSLLCACLSANLTRAGWWENVEVGHIEEIAENDRTSLADGMLSYADELVRAVEQARPNDELRARHAALNDIRSFLRQEVTQRERRSTDGRLHTHFDNGQTGLVDFLRSVAGSSLNGMCLEIISPYFDESPESKPLSSLIDAFSPTEVRLYLPQGTTGEALCDPEFYEWVRCLPNVTWGTLPKDLVKLGKAEEVRHRTVHAKVYRFFEPKRGGREVVYVGSTNLTQAGCRQPAAGGRGGVPGNWETGFLVEVTSGKRPDWWLAGEPRPTAFAPRSEDEGTAASGGTLLSLRYWWDRKQAEALWAGAETSPPLRIEHAGVAVLALPALPAREWQLLDEFQSRRLEQALISSSLFQVHSEGTEPGLLLVQEEGMANRPSVLLELSSADILRYWSLLTVEQRAGFIEGHAPSAGEDNPLAAKVAALGVEPTLFDRFAGVFHAFECVRERARNALSEDRQREADYRLFGKKYDSLGTLLARVVTEVKAGTGDLVEHYVVGLCAKQLLKELGREFPDYWKSHDADVTALQTQLQEAVSVRDAIATEHADMPAFLVWFDGWFLKRAEALPEVTQ